MFKLKGFVIILLICGFAFLSRAQENTGEAYFDLGVYAFEAKNFPDAEAGFKKALSLKPDHALYHHYLGKTYLAMAQYAFAEKHLLRAQELDQDLVGLPYDIATLYYKQEKYARAADYFQMVLRDEPDNVLAQYHCGICLYQQEKYDEALFYFSSASEKSPSIKPNGYYWAGVCSMKIGDYDDAIQRLTYVKDKAESENLRSNAVNWLSKIEKQKKKKLKPYSLFVRAGYGYDSNVTLDPIDDDLVTDEDDYLGTFYFSGSYDLIHKSKYIVGAGYNHYQSLHSRLTEYNLAGSIGNIYARFITGPVKISLSYLPHYYWLDGEDYLRRHQIMPDITWRVRSNLIARFSYSYYDNDYFKDDPRDGNTHEPFLSGYYFLGQQGGYLYGGLGYEKNDARSPDQDYYKVKIRAGLSVGLVWKLKLGVNGRYDIKNYENVDSIIGITREDDKYFGAVTLSRMIYFDWLTLTGEYNYTLNNSNVTRYEYDRHVGTLYLSAGF